MLYYLLSSLVNLFSVFNIFRYISVRALLASITAFLCTFLLFPLFIRWLKRYGVGENIRKEYKDLYLLQRKKEGTPTMGGVLIIASVVISVICWADIFNQYIWLILSSLLYLGGLGFVDDYIKLIKRRSSGLTPTVKFLAQIVWGVFIGLFLMTNYPPKLHLPFFKHLVFNLGWFYLLWTAFIISAFSNAVNLTDGLDGLAIGCVVIVAFVYAIIGYLCGNVRFSHYLFIPYSPYGGEVGIFCAAIVGAGLGFLWYNCYPAEIFMGDSGSLALGGCLGLSALLLKHEVLLILVGGVFTLEALSVLLQVVYFKTKRKRIFLMSPVHHHFQIKGLAEPKVVVRFWIMGLIFGLLGLLTLKIR
ncbi:MAG: phospho-N-acetylmuramoyl-pentapeptide-transferase [Candidatus Omnitrophota bacterium]|nr:MAG: phospho-N-acetylmuramoyl-pentapeptide-transferase [Candidatus Omnitrophota bacterium]